jgi:hypothetical protein
MTNLERRGFPWPLHLPDTVLDRAERVLAAWEADPIPNMPALVKRFRLPAKRVELLAVTGMALRRFREAINRSRALCGKEPI